jgi:hypothetical protein
MKRRLIIMKKNKILIATILCIVFLSFGMTSYADIPNEYNTSSGIFIAKENIEKYTSNYYVPIRLDGVTCNLAYDKHGNKFYVFDYNNAKILGNNLLLNKFDMFGYDLTDWVAYFLYYCYDEPNINSIGEMILEMTIRINEDDRLYFKVPYYGYDLG